MANLAKRLDQIAHVCEAISVRINRKPHSSALAALKRQATSVGRAWCGSCLGYHACVYYRDLKRPPPGVEFDYRDGLPEPFYPDEAPDWIEYPFGKVIGVIERAAGKPRLGELRKVANQAATDVVEARERLLSALNAVFTTCSDPYVVRLLKDTEAAIPLSAKRCVDARLPTSLPSTADRRAARGGIQIPPHAKILCEVEVTESTFSTAKRLASIARHAIEHLDNRAETSHRSLGGDKVFIGHGGARVWKELRDFIRDRVKLPWDEFNRVPVAGVANITRLRQMLDSAAIAFLVMTAEDEHGDGKAHARMNVVHEAGLFQGRLGFERAIVLIEEGCEEFSNIHGLGQIRFPAGNIAAKFEDVRLVLEREGLIGDAKRTGKVALTKRAD